MKIKSLLQSVGPRRCVNKLVLAIFALTLASPAFPGANFLGGNIIDINSTTAGLQIRLDTGVRITALVRLLDGCRSRQRKSDGRAHSDRKLQNTPVVVYTNGLDASGTCIVGQVDPNG